MIDTQRPQARIVIWQIDADAIDAVVLHLDESIVSEALKGDRQSRGVARYAGDRPTLSEAVPGAKQFVEREFVVVAEDEVVFQVECRNRVFPTEIKGIDLLLDAGGPR